jgi:hypothetical protein
VKYIKFYILYIYRREITREALKMALKNMKKINSKLQDIYKDQVTTTVATQPEPFVDRSELLLEQMNFIATYNKQLLHIA